MKFIRVLKASKETLKINCLLDYSNSALFPNLKTNEDKIITKIQN